MPAQQLVIGVSANNQIPTWSLPLPKKSGESVHYLSASEQNVSIDVPPYATDALIDTGGVTYYVSEDIIEPLPLNVPTDTKQVQNRQMVQVAGLAQINILTEDVASVNIQWFNNSIL
jgi:hypothetical protein